MDSTDRQIVNKTKTGKPVTHGSSSSYNNHRCRCVPCTDAWAKYIQSKGYVKTWRAKKKRKGVNINL